MHDIDGLNSNFTTRRTVANSGQGLKDEPKKIEIKLEK